MGYFRADTGLEAETGGDGMIGMVHRILRFSGSNARRIRLAYPVVFLKSLCMNVPLMTAYVLLTAYLHQRGCAVRCIPASGAADESV